jgi:hypothetical protein
MDPKPSIMLEISYKENWVDPMTIPLGPGSSNYGGGNYSEKYFCEHCGTTFHPTGPNGLREERTKEENWKYFYSLLEGTKKVGLKKDFKDFRESIFLRYHENKDFNFLGYRDPVFEEKIAKVFSKESSPWLFVQEVIRTDSRFSKKIFIVPGVGLVEHSPQSTIMKSDVQEALRTDPVSTVKKHLNDFFDTVKNEPLPEGSEPAVIVCFPESQMQYHVFAVPESAIEIAR